MAIPFSATLALLLGAAWPNAAAPSSRDLQLRLLTPLASYSHPGTPFRARVLGPIKAGKGSPLPAGTILTGTVREAHPVGLGLRRERASLALRFEACLAPTGEPLPCEIQLLAVDNAREQVSEGNRIRGILAASHPHNWVGGVWFRPAREFAQRSAAGLTGASGMIQANFAAHPIGTISVVATRLALLRLPDSEIDLPVGTELIVRASTNAQAEEEQLVEPTPELADWTAELPVQIHQADRNPAQDIINVALAGSREQLIRAFTAAGWSPADPLTPKTFARTYAAFARMRSYSSAPVSHLFYNGALPELVFQKSFNSLAARHHIRLWPVDGPNGITWVGAATHDVSIAFDWSRTRFTHRIDPLIDRERTKVANDLADTACVDDLQTIARPHLAQNSTLSQRALTDGGLLLVNLRSCQPARLPDLTLRRAHNAFPIPLARRVVLETRYYLTRGNAYYWAYRGARWSLSPHARRRPLTND